MAGQWNLTEQWYRCFILAANYLPQRLLNKKLMNPKPTKRRRTSQDSCMNTSNREDTTVENISDENDESDAFNSATNYDDSVHDESDFEWEHLSEFSSSESETDSEDSDWDP